MWYEDVEQAVEAQVNGEVVLAVDLSRQRLKTLPQDLMLLDLTYLIVSRSKLSRFPIGFKKKGFEGLGGRPSHQDFLRCCSDAQCGAAQFGKAT